MMHVLYSYYVPPITSDAWSSWSEAELLTVYTNDHVDALVSLYEHIRHIDTTRYFPWEVIVKFKKHAQIDLLAMNGSNTNLQAVIGKPSAVWTTASILKSKDTLIPERLDTLLEYMYNSYHCEEETCHALNIQKQCENIAYRRKATSDIDTDLGFSELLDVL